LKTAYLPTKHDVNMAELINVSDQNIALEMLPDVIGSLFELANGKAVNDPSLYHSADDDGLAAAALQWPALQRGFVWACLLSNGVTEWIVDSN
jgi:hypothetical protein